MGTVLLRGISEGLVGYGKAARVLLRRQCLGIPRKKTCLLTANNVAGLLATPELTVAQSILTIPGVIVTGAPKFDEISVQIKAVRTTRKFEKRPTKTQ